MRLQVRCNNSECDEFNEERVTQYPTLPGGFFHGGPILCKCGQEPQIISRETPRKQGWI